MTPYPQLTPKRQANRRFSAARGSARLPEVEDDLKTLVAVRKYAKRNKRAELWMSLSQPITDLRNKRGAIIRLLNEGLNDVRLNCDGEKKG